jgi:sulfide:quinone oxidoreductase
MAQIRFWPDARTMRRSAKQAHAVGPVVIVGGGNAGVSIAARLRRRGVAEVTIIEPRREHVYAPLQSHIAGGVADRREVIRPQAKVTPRGVAWLQERVVAVHTDDNAVELSSGRRVGYGQLIIAAGIEQRWDAIPGLAEAVAGSSVVSNYTLELADEASNALRNLDAGTVVFTQAAEPASCAGVAQKPMYLACDRWQKLGLLPGIRVVFVTPEAAPFDIDEIASQLRRSLDAYGIETHYGTTIAEVRADVGELDVVVAGQTTTIGYDVLHAAPPHAPAGWITESGLQGADGFVDVDPETLRHRRWANIWALGDAASVTPIRSGGAIRSQAKVITDALTRPQKNSRYDGYSETPFTVTRRTAVFAEFDRSGRLQPSIPFWRTLYRERRFTYVMDRRVLPWVYWNLILKGRA